MTEREIARMFRVWTQSIVPPIITSLLFLLIFGHALGDRLSPSPELSYLQFIIPGLVMMGIMTSSYANTSFSLFISRFHEMTQEWLSAPIPYWQIVAALTIGGVIRGLVVGAGILLASLFFGSVPLANIGVILYFSLMASLLFSFAGIITALWAKNFDRLNVFATFIITPLTYLGGVFYSLSMLPKEWASAARWNPMFLMVDGFRYGFFGRSDVVLWISMLLVFVLTFLFGIWCVYLFRKGYGLRT